MAIYNELLVTFDRTEATDSRDAIKVMEQRLAADPTFFKSDGIPLGRFHYQVCQYFETGGIFSGRLSAVRLPLDFSELTARVRELSIRNDEPLTPIRFSEDFLFVEGYGEELEKELNTDPIKIARRLEQRARNKLERRYQRLWRLLGGAGLSPSTRDYVPEDKNSFDKDVSEDDAQIVDEVLYERLLKRYELQSEVEADGTVVYVDLDRDIVTRKFIGNKWLSVVECRSI